MQVKSSSMAPFSASGYNATQQDLRSFLNIVLLVLSNTSVAMCFGAFWVILFVFDARRLTAVQFRGVSFW